MSEKKMLVKDAMRKQIIAAKESTTLKELVQIFYKYNFHALPVIKENNKLVGIVALEDVLKIFEPSPPHIMETLRRSPFWDELEETNISEVDIPAGMGVLFIVKDLMNTDVITIDEEATITQTRSLLKLHHLKRLPVVDKTGYLKGIISLLDIIIAIFKEKGIL